MTSIANEIAERVNRSGIGPWLAELSARIGTDPIPPLTPGQQFVTNAPGITLWLLRIERRSTSVARSELDDVVIERASFDPAASALPFGIEAERETPASARSKLSSDTVAGDAASAAAGGRRISHFLAQGLVVECAFRPSMIGIDRILIARLGAPVQHADGS